MQKSFVCSAAASSDEAACLMTTIMKKVGNFHWTDLMEPGVGTLPCVVHEAQFLLRKRETIYRLNDYTPSSLTLARFRFLGSFRLDVVVFFSFTFFLKVNRILEGINEQTFIFWMNWRMYMTCHVNLIIHINYTRMNCYLVLHDTRVFKLCRSFCESVPVYFLLLVKKVFNIKSQSVSTCNQLLYFCGLPEEKGIPGCLLSLLEARFNFLTWLKLWYLDLPIPTQ